MTDLVTLTVRNEPPDTLVVTAVGEVDISNCGMLELTFDKLGSASRVVVDMSRCTFFDSSCLAVLARYARSLRDEGRDFRVIVDAQGRRVIELTKLSELLGLDESQSSVVGVDAWLDEPPGTE